MNQHFCIEALALSNLVTLAVLTVLIIYVINIT